MPPRKQKRAPRTIVGVDIGGTFTDLVVIVDGELRVHKTRSTPADPAQAVRRGLSDLLGSARVDVFTYSSTVATNALLEKKGARVVLVTNAGFEDLIEIGRQNRAHLYALAPSRPEPLVTRAHRIGVAERTLFDGTIATPLTAREIARVRNRVVKARPEAIAICLLHSYANGESERRLADALAGMGVHVTVSHELMPEYREVERLSTAIINAYVAPKMVAHLTGLERDVAARRFRVMQSSGTAVRSAIVCEQPMRTILSGPAAGVVGVARLARSFGVDRFITFDMGGTSTDVSLYDGGPRRRTLSEPEGYPLKTPVIDIHTVGAGGGSIARVDAGRSLKVGPKSAGSDPGPACYGTGRDPTVTDANLVAGRLVAERFLGGRMTLDAARAREAISRLARAMKTTPEAAARGVLRVVNASMERAIRVITVERGVDPRQLALIAFGGAGPMHACELALNLGIRHVILPRTPGLLCAVGALAAPLGREEAVTIRLVEPDTEALLRRARPLVRRLERDLVREGASARTVTHEISADLRYRGESWEIAVPLGKWWRRDFDDAHRRLFGHAAPDAEVEAVSLRVRVNAPEAGFQPPRERAARRLAPRPSGSVRVALARGQREVPVIERDSLRAGARLPGPALLVELSSTAWVPPGFSGRVDEGGNLHLEA